MEGYSGEMAVQWTKHGDIGGRELTLTARHWAKGFMSIVSLNLNNKDMRQGYSPQIAKLKVPCNIGTQATETMLANGGQRELNGQ